MSISKLNNLNEFERRNSKYLLFKKGIAQDFGRVKSQVYLVNDNEHVLLEDFNNEKDSKNFGINQYFRSKTGDLLEKYNKYTENSGKMISYFSMDNSNPQQDVTLKQNFEKIFEFKKSLSMNNNIKIPSFDKSPKNPELYRDENQKHEIKENASAQIANNNINDNKIKKNYKSSMFQPMSSLVACMICERSCQLEKVFKVKCGHRICVRCSKFYYEDKLEQGDFNMVCPFYFCQVPVEENSIIKVISPTHYENYKKSKQIIQIPIQNNFFFGNRKSQNYIKKISKHTIEVNTSHDAFLTMTRYYKENLCRKCSFPTIFGKFNKHYLRCLNCLFKFCRVCMREFTYDHLNLNSSQFCKITYSRYRTTMNEEKLNEKVLVRDFDRLFSVAQILSFLFFVIGILVWFWNQVGIIFGLLKYSNYLLRLTKRLICYIIQILGSLILLIFSILLCPLYPSLVTAGDYILN